MSQRDELSYKIKASLYDNKRILTSVGDVYQLFLDWDEKTIGRLEAEPDSILCYDIDGYEVIQDNILVIVVTTRHLSILMELEAMLEELRTLGDIMILIDSDSYYYYYDCGLGLYGDSEYYLELASVDGSVSVVEFFKDAKATLNYILAVFPEFIDEILKQSWLSFDNPSYILTYLCDNYMDFENSNCEFMYLSCRGEDENE
jgi:hypothetical protein